MVCCKVNALFDWVLCKDGKICYKFCFLSHRYIKTPHFGQPTETPYLCPRKQEERRPGLVNINTLCVQATQNLQ